MTDIRFDSIIFDFDGTLVDTGPDLTASLNHALGALGRPVVSEAAVRDMVGHGARKLLERGLGATGGWTEALVDEGFPIFIDYYSRNICVHSAPFAGVERALDDLAARGIRLGVCTNKPEALSVKLLAALGWTDRFQALIGGDTLAVRKPDPTPLMETARRLRSAAPAFIGDSITDTVTARAAGVPCVAVSFGFSDRPVDALGATAVIHHFDELVPTLSSL